MFKFIFFDLDGVFRHWNPEDVALIERDAKLPVGAIMKTAFCPGLLLPAISGKITDEEWRSAISARLQFDFPTCKVNRVVELWSRSPGSIDPDVIGVIENLSAHLSVGLITNATSRLNSDLDRLGIVQRFAAIINSSEVGFPKPGEEIFRHALDRQGISADQAFFVDDSRENVLAASAIGIEGHVFETASSLRAELNRRGLLR